MGGDELGYPWKALGDEAKWKEADHLVSMLLGLNVSS